MVCGTVYLRTTLCNLFPRKAGRYFLSSIPIVGELFSGPAFGIGILAAGVILAIMIIPYIASVMRDVLNRRLS